METFCWISSVGLSFKYAVYRTLIVGMKYKTVYKSLTSLKQNTGILCANPQNDIHLKFWKSNNSKTVEFTQLQQSN